MQTETLKKLYDYMKKNKVTDFEFYVDENETKIILQNLGIKDVDSLEIFEEGTQDLIFINSSKPL